MGLNKSCHAYRGASYARIMAGRVRRIGKMGMNNWKKGTNNWKKGTNSGRRGTNSGKNRQSFSFTGSLVNDEKALLHACAPSATLHLSNIPPTMSVRAYVQRHTNGATRCDIVHRAATPTSSEHVADHA